MDPIDSQDVWAIARLARLELLPEEVERFRVELSTILAYVARLEGLDAGAAADPAPADQPPRPDVPLPWPEPRVLHDQAADFVEGFYRVPRVVE